MSDDENEESYTKVRVLGRGSFGEAVLYSKKDGSLVVWKEVNIGNLSREQRAETDNEIEILACLQYPNIITYYQHFLSPDTLYIEMSYADGESLYHEIVARNGALFTEDEVLWYAYQMISALNYMHGKGIWHRDMKTLNVFTTSTGLCQLGDFGMSKATKSDEMMDSCVGTPYYMCPEIVKGEPYDERCDIWALGCCIHEMLTLTRTFQASNTLKLASIVVRGKIAPIDEMYSEEMTTKINMCLEKEMSDRCFAADLLSSSLISSKLPEFELRLLSLCPTHPAIPLNESTTSLLTTSSEASTAQPRVTQSTSRLLIKNRSHTWHRVPLDTGASSSEADRTEQCIKVAMGGRHTVVVNADRHLYTFAQEHDTHHGEASMVGQLGHGTRAAYKSPKRVADLTGVRSVACGLDFTLVLIDDGTLMSFGSNYEGTLGIDDESVEESLHPVIVALLTPVRRIAAGERHCLATTDDGRIFVWGSAEWGRLGLGADQEAPVFCPTEVHIRTITPGTVLRPYCSADASFLITSDGVIYATGTNTANKLGLNRAANIGARLSYDTDFVSQFHRVPSIRGVVDLASCATHTIVCTVDGMCFTFGSNECGQLGLGHVREMKGRVCKVPIAEKVIRVACADGLSVVATSNAVIHSWGTAIKGSLQISTFDFSEDITITMRVRQLSCSGSSVAAIVEHVTKEIVLNIPHEDEIVVDIVEENLRLEMEGCEMSEEPYLKEISEGSTRKVTDEPLPEWLANELADASVIQQKPIVGIEPKFEKEEHLDKIARLKEENEQLRTQVETLQNRVEMLEARLFSASVRGENIFKEQISDDFLV